MLPIDSLVMDLIFEAGTSPQPQDLVDALGGEEVVGARKILDPDMQDPRFEMELSPSIPFRRRGERRLMIVDDANAPLREDPRADPVVNVDLREEKQRLVDVCKLGIIRFGRIFALGLWGDAVMIAKSARDLRGMALLSWVLDPAVDVEGKRRATRLTQAEFEEKVMAYDKRLDELDDEEILANLGPVNFARQDDLLIVDVLENDGTWDVRKSLALEDKLAALDRFSLIPGAKSTAGKPAEPKASGKAAKKAAKKAKHKQRAAEAAVAETAAQPVPTGPPLTAAEVNGDMVLIFPRERFDLDIAAAMGKNDWDAVLGPQDLEGAQRDHVFRNGARFIAPLEFLSEVFVDGKPLSKPEFENTARQVGSARILEVHCPRFGPVILVELGDRGRFISSLTDQPGAVVELLG